MRKPSTKHKMKGSVFGISAFKGPEGHKSPHHAFVTGKTGSGKSVFVNDLLTQIDSYAHKIVVVDNGNSYGVTTGVLSGGKCRPFAPDPNGQDTLNYLDTGGLPLSPLFLSSVVSVLHLMSGHKPAEDEDFLRGAILSRCVRLFLDSWSKQWVKKKAPRKNRCRRLLATLRRFAGETRLKGDLTDLYTAYRNTPAEQMNIDKRALDEEIRRINPDDDDLMKLSFALMSREEAPTHSDFHDWLDTHSREAERNREELDKLVTLLEVWRADLGIMGQLFDGVNTIDLDAKHVHIELGLIQEADPKIRALVSFVLSNKILGAITRMPRSQRKHVVLEELGSFLNVDGAKQIVRDFYERSRKLNCFVLSVIQQISNLPEDIARSVIGNCRQGFFFAQKDVKDVALLQELFELPDSIAEQLRSFKEPSPEHGAPFICWEDLGERTRITSVSNIASPEMLYVANSSGAAFEERASALAQYDDLLEGVSEEATK